MRRFLGRIDVQLFLTGLLSVVLSHILVVQIPDVELQGSAIFLVLVLHLIATYLSDFTDDFHLKGYLKLFEKVLFYSLIFAILLSFSAFMMRGGFSISRRGLLYFSSVNTLFVYVTSSLVKFLGRQASSLPFNQKKTMLVTTASRLPLIWNLLLSEGMISEQIVAVLVLGQEESRHELEIPLVSEDDAVAFANRNIVDCVFIDLPNERKQLQYWVTEFETMGIDVHVNLNLFDFETIGSKRVQSFAGQTVLTFATKFHKRSHVFAKRIVDIVGAIVGLCLCGLVSIVLVPLIRKDGGPAIFAQKRVGKNGRIFTFYKFRSMYVDAEERKKDLLNQNQMQGGMFKMDNDPRITPIGHFIRKTSLDELPQFYNVLIGDMSLVGTRPPTVDEFEHYTPMQKRRLSFKPGITGLWQVSGRSDITDFNEVVRLDLTYIDNWTIWSDIKILLKTVKVVLLREGSK